MSTPTAVGLHTRRMAELFDANTFVSVEKGGQSLFGRAETGGKSYYDPNSNTVDIDMIDANDKRLAAMIKRGVSRKISNLPADITGVFRTENYNYPLIHQEGIVSASQLLNRLPGEDPYKPFTKMQRLLIQAAKLHMNQAQAAVRCMEYLAWQSIITGTMPALIGATAAALLYNFQRAAGNSITVGTAWDVDSAVPMDNIDTACDAVIENGRVIPEFIFMGADAHAAFIRDAEVQSFADNRRYEFVRAGRELSVPPRFGFLVENGFTPIGQITTPRGRILWIFTYDFSYIDGDGNTQYYLPRDTAVVGRLSRFDRYFGPSEFMPPEIRMNREVYGLLGYSSNATFAPGVDTFANIIDYNAFDFDIQIEKNAYSVETQIAPIFALTHANAIAVLSGLITPSET